MAYTLTGSSGDIVRFLPDMGTINRESERLSSQVTSNPIEGGSDIHDNVKNDPSRIILGGILIGGDETKNKLKKMRDRRDIITYIGRIRENNLVFTNLQFNADPSNKNGWLLSVQFQKVDITAPQLVDLGAIPLARPVANVGRQTTQPQKVTATAYAAHVQSFTGPASTGPATRNIPSFSGGEIIM
jgi:hypothetical protein